MYYKFKNMKWNTLADFDPKLKGCSSDMMLYHYLGKTQGRDGMGKLEFRYWKRGDKLYAEVLEDLEPKYFVEVESLNNLEEIEKTYLVEDDCKLVGDDSLINVHNENFEKGKRYERFDPDFDSDNYIDMYIGSVNSVDDMEKSMLLEDCVYPMPVRLATASYADKEETPKLSVYKTYLSRSLLEFFSFDKAVNEEGYFPVFCRAIYKGDKVPVDLQKFMDKNIKLSLDDYILEGEKSDNYKHNVCVMSVLRDHLVEDYIEEHFTDE